MVAPGNLSQKPPFAVKTAQKRGLDMVWPV
jgi:hypothetical protein